MPGPKILSTVLDIPSHVIALRRSSRTTPALENDDRFGAGQPDAVVVSEAQLSEEGAEMKLPKLTSLVIIICMNILSQVSCPDDGI